MELWSAAVEAMRPEARATVAAAVPFVRELLGVDAPHDPDRDLVAQARLMRETFAAFGVAVPEGADEEIAGVRCRVFRTGGQARAIYVHVHGGGMIAGAPEVSDAANRDLSARLGVAVVSVDYRLAPEHPHPAPVDDVLAVVVWLVDNGARELGASKIVLGGESAGAYLAVAALLRLRDEFGAADVVAGANLTFGVYDWGRSPSQRGVRPSDCPDVLSPDGLAFSAECYLPGLSDDERRDPSISPAYASLNDLPPAFFAVGTADHLLDDTLLLAARWAAAGNPTELFVAPDMPHTFTGFACAMTEAWSSARYRWLEHICGSTV
jgi:acetyl esterase/lipase